MVLDAALTPTTITPSNTHLDSSINTNRMPIGGLAVDLTLSNCSDWSLFAWNRTVTGCGLISAMELSFFSSSIYHSSSSWRLPTCYHPSGGVPMRDTISDLLMVSSMTSKIMSRSWLTSWERNLWQEENMLIRLSSYTTVKKSMIMRLSSLRDTDESKQFPKCAHITII